MTNSQTKAIQAALSEKSGRMSSVATAKIH